MNNLQYIVKDNTRYAMHVAVELCEQGDFDSPYEAIRWLMQERTCEYEAMNEYVCASHGEPLANEDGEISIARKEIVRCRDCRFYKPSSYSHFTCCLCSDLAEPNDFCAWGEDNER